MTFLVSLFVTSRNLLFGVFLPRKIISILRKIVANFRQVSLKGVLLWKWFWNGSGKSFKSSSEKVESLKTLYYTWTSSEVIFKITNRIFFTYLPIHLFVCYTAHIFFIRIHIFKRFYFPLLLFLRWEAKKITLSFWIIFAALFAQFI